MPRVRRIAKRKREINPMVVAYLAAGSGQKLETDADGHFAIYMLRVANRVALRALWQEFGAGIVAQWITERPGRRPARWWEFDAPREVPDRNAGTRFEGELPEPRLRLGGGGKPSSEVWAAWMPSYTLGVPDSWEEYDENDPPVFEAEAAYLERFGLLTPAERRRLKPADFQPVAWDRQARIEAQTWQ